MKKVAIVSCYNHKNYGSILQALATQNALDKLGYENETINTNGFDKEIKKAKFKYFLKASLTTKFLFSKIGMAKSTLIRKFTKCDYANRSKVRNALLTEYSKTKFNLSCCYTSIDDLKEKSKSKYLSVVVGSDQLWLPGNIVANYYTLNWVPEELNTIALATSFGQASLPTDIIKKAAVFLKRINHISVREESGQKLVKKISGRKVPIVCDPTLLFTGEEWLRIIPYQKPLIDEPYIFVYYLGNNPLHRVFAKRLKAKTGYKLVALIHLDEYIKTDENYADFTPYDIDPSGFLNLIRNASYICTDSFHCSVFSILYKKNFFSFRRYNNKSTSSTNSRLDTLFKVSGIENRLLSGSENVVECIERKIDYSKVMERLYDIRKKSYEYLTFSLENERNTDL